MKEEIAIIGGGCFWCIEAIMQRLKGVELVESGYAGGNSPGQPTYREVCSGLTGHAEVVRIRFKPEQIPYKVLIKVFMTSHDPTTLNRQGGDHGTQYRSVIFYTSIEQKRIAENLFQELGEVYSKPIVTELKEASIFYLAEEDHHDYYNQNENQGYCRAVINPKIGKLRAQYAHLLKD